MPWNKGIKIDRNKYPKFGHFNKHTKEAKRKMVKNHKGRSGIKASLATLKKMSDWQIGRSKEYERGKKHWNWKGGISKLSRIIRGRVEWKLWRAKVFERDDYTCRFPKCKTRRGSYLEPHHIVPRRIDNNLIFDINNGITLCKKCHDRTKQRELEFVNLFRSLIK